MVNTTAKVFVVQQTSYYLYLQHLLKKNFFAVFQLKALKLVKYYNIGNSLTLSSLEGTMEAAELMGRWGLVRQDSGGFGE